MSKILFLFIFISCSSTLARRPAQVESSKELAALISKVYFTKISKIEINDINKILNGIKRYKIFLPYQEWAKSLHNIGLKNIKLPFCEQIKKDNYKNISFGYLKGNLKSKCFKYIYNEIDKVSLNDLSKVEFIFDGHYPYIIKNLSSNFEAFYARLKSSNKESKIRNNLIENFIEYQITPSEQFSKNFLHNSNFKKMYARLGPSSRSKRKEEMGKFRSILKKIYNAGGTDRFSKVFKDNFPSFIRNLNTQSNLLDSLDGIGHIKNFLPFLARNRKAKELRQTLDILNLKYKSINSIQNDATFYYIWSYLIEKQEKKALEYIRRERLVNRFNDLYSRPQYWIAETFRLNNFKSIANKLKLKIILTNTISYYATIAVKDLKQADKNLYQDALNYYNMYPVRRYSQSDYVNLSQVFSQSFERIRIFNEGSHATLMANEVNIIKDKSNLPSDIAPKLISIKLQEYGAYLSSFIMIYKALESKKIKYDREFLITSFPKPFRSEIKKHKASLNSILVFSLMRQESSFNPFAKSPVGALGLMQLMPKTARRYKPNVKNEELFTPNINIPIGTKYLEFLAEKFNNNLDFVLASYNAGEHRVDDWKNDYLNTDNTLHNIENIPYFETRKYVKLINRNIFFYNFIEEIIEGKKTAKR